MSARHFGFPVGHLIRVCEIVVSLARHFKLFVGHVIGFNYGSMALRRTFSNFAGHVRRVRRISHTLFN